MGDAAHQQRQSDHNQGDAFDLTHDPRNAEGEIVARLARRDRRARLVIWNRVLMKAQAIGGPWSASEYTGPDPHTSHVHVSIWPELRDDGGPWPWASSGVGLAVGVVGLLGAVVVGAVVVARRRS